MNEKSMIKKRKKIPQFKTEAAERKFWSSHDSADFIDWTKARKVRFVNLKPTTKSISLRLPLPLLEKVKSEANKKDVPYQSYLKVLIAEAVKK